jgi:hypothetical protein
MDNPETLAALSTEDTGKINVRGNRMDNQETLSTLSRRDTGQVDVRENQGGDQEWIIQRYCQH